ncbi:MAG: hypothetical protein AB1756_09655 [Acidobacteriota bacterium]
MKKELLIFLSALALILLSANLILAEEEKRGQFFIEMEDWYVKASNVDYEISTIQTGESSSNLSIPSSYGDSARYRLGWDFKNDLGAIEFIFWNHDNRDRIKRTDAGNFAFTQNLSPAPFAGVYDDGMADGVFSESKFVVRSLSLLFSRGLVNGERVKADWGIGVRKISHKHTFNTTYYFLTPKFSHQFIEPNFSHLIPLNDTLREVSSLEARGLETKASIFFPMMRRVSIGSDIAISYLIGRSRSEYVSKNHYYATSVGNYLDPKVEGLSFSEFDQQLTFTTAAKGREKDSAILITEADLKIIWNVWKTVNLTFGYALALWNGSMLRQDVNVADSSPESWDYLDVSQYSRAVRDDIVFQGLYMTVSYRY